MKKIIILISILYSSIALCDDSIGYNIDFLNTTITPYASLMFVDTSANKVPGQYNDIEDINEGVYGGVQFQSSIFAHLEAKGLLTYEPGFKDGSDLGFESILLELYECIGNLDFGYRYGRLIYSYGPEGNKRVNPVYRHDIINVSSNLWLNKNILYRHGDGQSGYLFYHLNSHSSFNLEYTDITKYNPKPIADYTNNADPDFGIEVESVDVIVKHISLDLYNTEVSYDEMNIVMNIDISNEHYETQFPMVPQFMRVIGVLTQPFELRSYSIKQWIGNFVGSAQNIEMEYLNTGTDKRYYNIFGLNGFEGTIRMMHTLFQYRPPNSKFANFYIERGWMMKGDGVGETDENRGHENCIGNRYDFTVKFSLKTQFCDIKNTQFLPFNENPDRSEMEEDWKLYAIQLTYQI